MSATVAIVAHTSRKADATRLADTVGADYLSVDDGTLGCDENHRAIWQWHRDNASTEWAVTLEDDALPVEGFRHQLDAALAAAPTPIVSLYMGTSRPASWQARIERATVWADNTDACFITSPRLLHAVAVAIRTDLIADMLEHLAPGKPIDNAISQWATNQLATPWCSYSWPSLIDHNDGASLVKHTYDPHSQPRRAWRTGTRNDWHGTTVTI